LLRKGQKGAGLFYAFVLLAENFSQKMAALKMAALKMAALKMAALKMAALVTRVATRMLVVALTRFVVG
jgi:hypothetical protein